ncbi:MAG: AEC family transporter [Actinomycetota bacterium]|nr:AEC family transporter [Actinomycetota bacterium]
MFLELARIILALVAIVGIGWLLRTTGMVKAEDARPINNIIIYVGLPAFIFSAVQPAELEIELIGVAAIAWIVFIVTAVLSWYVCKLLGLSDRTSGGFVLAASLGNTGYIGYPVAQQFLGDVGLVRAIFFDVFGTVAALLIVGLLVAQRKGSSDGGPVRPLREILTFPAVLALLAGLALHWWTVPDPVMDWLGVLSNLVVPLIMISVGVSLRPGTFRRYTIPLVVLFAIRMVMAPFVALVAGPLMMADFEAVRLVVLQAGMPSMMLTLVIGARFKLDTDFIASAILVTTVGSVITIPLMQLALG